MRYSGLFFICAAILMIAPCASGSGLLGVFQGTIVKSSSLNAKTHERWVYVRSRSGSVRKVNIAKALVEYDQDVPAKLRFKNPAESLRLATEVRITAEQDRSSDGGGDWQAKRVLILAAKAEVHGNDKAGVRKQITNLIEPRSAPKCSGSLKGAQCSLGLRAKLKVNSPKFHSALRNHPPKTNLNSCNSAS